MKLDVYVNYAGACEEAFRFYEQYLGGTVTRMMRHGEQPNSRVPDDWKDAILHARLEIGNVALMGADIPGAEPMRSTYLTLTLDSVSSAGPGLRGRFTRTRGRACSRVPRRALC